MKKRILSVLLLTFLLVSLIPTTALAAQNEITVYNWGQYISDGTDNSMDVIKEFEAETGIKVNYLTFDSNESMYTKLKTGGTSYDVIIPSDYMIAKLISEDMLEPIDFANTPNYQYIDEAFRDQAYDPENKYSVPYTWGTVGLIYNTQYVSDEDAKSWSCLWNSKYAGKLLMFDNPRDAFAIAESMLGYSYNTEDAQELKNAADLLATQKPVLQAYVMDQIFDKLERGEAWAAPYYAGDYLTMVEENPDLAFSFPEEGFNIFIDAMCIPKGCQNKEGAEAFINFLCRPDVSAANLDYIGYSTPETAAKEYMDEELSLQSVSERLHISANYLGANIKKFYGDTFMNLLIQKRMDVALKLLWGGSSRIAEVSRRCGYADQSYFGYCFKKYYGKSPARMRQEQKEANA